MDTLLELILGLALGTAISLLAWRVGALSASGAWAAALTGGLIFGLGGWNWASLLLAFFISSSALSRLFQRQKTAVSEKFAKSSRRDWGQVAANGALGALLVIIHTLRPEQGWVWAAYAGALAAVNADTWATELGVLSPSAPRLITSGRQVERGTSGGVTPPGCLAAGLGAGLIALLAACPGGGLNSWRLALSVLLAGIVGSSVDSWLGATHQAIYYCPACQKETEHSPRHSCGAVTHWLRGWHWLNNDWVNLFCSLAGAGTASLLWLLAG